MTAGMRCGEEPGERGRAAARMGWASLSLLGGRASHRLGGAGAGRWAAWRRFVPGVPGAAACDPGSCAGMAWQSGCQRRHGMGPGSGPGQGQGHEQGARRASALPTRVQNAARGGTKSVPCSASGGSQFRKREAPIGPCQLTPARNSQGNRRRSQSRARRWSPRHSGRLAYPCSHPNLLCGPRQHPPLIVTRSTGQQWRATAHQPFRRMMAYPANSAKPSIDCHVVGQRLAWTCALRRTDAVGWGD